MAPGTPFWTPRGGYPPQLDPPGGGTPPIGPMDSQFNPIGPYGLNWGGVPPLFDPPDPKKWPFGPKNHDPSTSEGPPGMSPQNHDPSTSEPAGGGYWPVFDPRTPHFNWPLWTFQLGPPQGGYPPQLGPMDSQFNPIGPYGLNWGGYPPFLDPPDLRGWASLQDRCLIQLDPMDFQLKNGHFWAFLAT